MEVQPLTFPKSGVANQHDTFNAPGPIVLVGANGSGKTRFSIWVETHQTGRVHRLSAQKALSIPEVAPLQSIEQATKGLFFGRSDQHGSEQRKQYDRWAGSPASHLLSDYDQLLSLLFAKEAQRNAEYIDAARKQGTFVEPPLSPLDRITQIWSDVMPHREIVLSDSTVLVRPSGSGQSHYHGKEMSDGERVVLYFMGQCLVAPAGSLLIVDEPETYLHKSIVSKLWDKIEEACPDVRMLYITHDLDFATSRADATKIWIQKYSAGDIWHWEVIQETAGLPERLLMEIMGSRKEIMFCEGEIGSLDTTIYQLVFPEFHVVPRGNCEKVIEATKALASTNTLHYKNCRGLIDSDYRAQEEIDALLTHRIFVLP